MTERPIRTLIVDDEPLARQRLSRLLTAESDFAVVGSSGDGRTAVSDLRRLEPDLVFLDITMPALDGFGVVAEIGADRMPSTIFVTAHQDHALEAFAVHAVDYLVKPFDRRRFQDALAAARRQVEGARDAERGRRLTALLADLQVTAEPPARLQVRTAGRTVLIAEQDIHWIDAAGNYVVLHTDDGQLRVRHALTHLEARLRSTRLLRIHRSTIVHLDRIREIHSSPGGDHTVILIGGQRLTVGRSFHQRLVAALD